MRVSVRSVNSSAGPIRSPCEERVRAVESAGGLGYLLAQQLLAAGEHVVDVPATLAARVLLSGTGRSDKNDPNDARSFRPSRAPGPADRGAGRGPRDGVADVARCSQIDGPAAAVCDSTPWSASSRRERRSRRGLAVAGLTLPGAVGGTAPAPSSTRWTGSRVAPYPRNVARFANADRCAPGRAFYDRKREEGHTTKTVIRALKRRLSNVVYRHLVADTQRARTGR